MTNLDTLRALVELGEKATSAQLSPVFSLKTGWVIGRIIDHVAHPLNTTDAALATDFACAAANARPALAALIAEFEKAQTLIAQISLKQVAAPHKAALDFLTEQESA